MLHGQTYGNVGYQSKQSEGCTVGKLASRAMLRALYVEGKLSLSQVVSVAKPIDHAKALASGKLDVQEAIRLGVDLNKARIAYNRTTGTGKVSHARKLGQSATIDAEQALLANNPKDVALAKLVATRQEARAQAKKAKQGKVYTAQEIAALQASLTR